METGFFRFLSVRLRVHPWFQIPSFLVSWRLGGKRKESVVADRIVVLGAGALSLGFFGPSSRTNTR